MIKLCKDMYNGTAVNKDGRTPYETIRGKIWGESPPQFGEQVMDRKEDENILEANNQRGTFVGYSNMANEKLSETLRRPISIAVSDPEYVGDANDVWQAHRNGDSKKTARVKLPKEADDRQIALLTDGIKKKAPAPGQTNNATKKEDNATATSGEPLSEEEIRRFRGTLMARSSGEAELYGIRSAISAGMSATSLRADFDVEVELKV